MKVTLVSSPSTVQSELFGSQLAALLTSNTGAARFTFFKVAVAFVKVSGLGRLAPAIASFKTAGGRAVLAAGIDLRGTSEQALDQALHLFDEVYVYFDEDRQRTYHPKLFILKNVNEAYVYVGSNNLTAGGLYTNYELAVAVELNLSIATDSAFLVEAETVFDTYSSGRGISQRLTRSLLQMLATDGLLADETRPDPKTMLSVPQKRTRPKRSHNKRYATAPPLTTQFAVLLKRRESLRNRPTPTYAHNATSLQLRGFWKRLSNNDVSKGSSPGQIIIPKSFISYFPPLSPTQNPYLKESRFAAEFVDSSGNAVPAPDSRLILYIPKPSQARPNIEHRFTFRDKTISSLLNAGDILAFELQPPPYPLRVWHVATASPAFASFIGDNGIL